MKQLSAWLQLNYSSTQEVSQLKSLTRYSFPPSSPMLFSFRHKTSHPHTDQSCSSWTTQCPPEMRTCFGEGESKAHIMRRAPGILQNPVFLFWTFILKITIKYSFGNSGCLVNKYFKSVLLTNYDRLRKSCYIFSKPQLQPHLFPLVLIKGINSGCEHLDDPA